MQTRRIDPTPVDRAAVVARLAALAPWHFRIEVLPGLWTDDFNRESYDEPHKHKVGVVDPQKLGPLFSALFPEGVTGKTFLDAGCNAGGYGLVARALGFARADGFDARSHWIDQALYLKSLLRPGDDELCYHHMRLEEWSHDDRYDLTLFKGLFYHLADPIHGLLRLASLTREVLIVDTVTSSDIPEACLCPVRETTVAVMSGVDGLAWLPGGPACLIPILTLAGFPHVSVQYWRKSTPWNEKRGRMQLIAARDGARLGHIPPSAVRNLERSET